MLFYSDSLNLELIGCKGNVGGNPDIYDIRGRWEMGGAHSGLVIMVQMTVNLLR